VSEDVVEPGPTVTITAVDHDAASFEYTTHPVHGTDYELRFGKPTGPDTIVMHPKNYEALMRWQEEQDAFKAMNRKQRRAEMARRRKR
jgi:hypothetical protein